MSQYIRNWFSNMLPFDKNFYGPDDGICYHTPENYYQAMKTIDLNERIKIANVSPYESKKLGRKIVLRDDLIWDEIKLKVMITVISYKFVPGTFWYKKLMETSNEEIVEINNWCDNY